MPGTPRTLFVLGGTGFIGRHVLAAAVDAGFVVHALTRRPTSVPALTEAGVQAVVGDATEPASWAARAASSDIVLDLTQPPLPARLTTRAVRAAAAQRLAGTRALTHTLARAGDRAPLLVVASGADDLQPDADGHVFDDSPVRQRPRGFGHIGIPVRRAIEDSAVPAAFVYLGNVVYGDGKAFAEQLVPQVRSGAARVVGRGDNRLPLTHVEDAAGALVHLAGLPVTDLVGRSFLAVPLAPITQRAFLAATAAAVGAATPHSVPTAVAALAAGRAAAETMTLDAVAHPTRLLASGFTFRHPDPAEGIRSAVAGLTAPALGATSA